MSTTTSEMLAKFESYPWLGRNGPTQEPPTDATKLVVLVPLSVPEPAAPDIGGFITSDFVTFLTERQFCIAAVRLARTVDLRQIFQLVRTADAVMVLGIRGLITSTDGTQAKWITETLATIAHFSRSAGIRHLYSVALGASVPTGEFIEVVNEAAPNITSDVHIAASQFANFYIAETAGAVVQQEARKERQERIERNAAEYIEDAIGALKVREARWKLIANACHAAGFATLLGGIGVVVYYSAQTAGGVDSEAGWPVLIYSGLKSVIIVGLLVAASKYAFTIGKSYMNEALKNADRIHAINFGKFYLNAYGDTATWSDLKEVFQHWNIAKDSGFAALDSSQFDPQLLSTAVEIAKSLSAAARQEATKK